MSITIKIVDPLGLEYTVSTSGDFRRYAALLLFPRDRPFVPHETDGDSLDDMDVEATAEVHDFAAMQTGPESWTISPTEKSEANRLRQAAAKGSAS